VARGSVGVLVLRPTEHQYRSVNYLLSLDLRNDFVLLTSPFRICKTFGEERVQWHPEPNATKNEPGQTSVTGFADDCDCEEIASIYLYLNGVNGVNLPVLGRHSGCVQVMP
jgi:hypothetical protein